MLGRGVSITVALALLVALAASGVTQAAPRAAKHHTACEVAADVLDDVRKGIRGVFGAEPPKGRDAMARGCSKVWGDIAKGFTKRDSEGLDDATEDAMNDERGGRREYNAKDAKQKVLLETVGSESRNRPVQFTLLKSVSPPPGGVVVVAKPFRTTAVLNLRSSPDLKKAENVVGSFAKGEVVAVMARTTDGWALIGAQGYDKDAPDDYVGVGYASMQYLVDPALKAAPLRKAKTARPKLASASGGKGPVAAAPVQKSTVKASTQCKTVSASTGQSRESKTGCATPAGRYEVV